MPRAILQIPAFLWLLWVSTELLRPVIQAIDALTQHGGLPYWGYSALTLLAVMVFCEDLPEEKRNKILGAMVVVILLIRFLLSYQYYADLEY